MIRYPAPVAGSSPLAFVELFVTSATLGGDPARPVRVDLPDGQGGSFLFEPNSHTYVVRVVDTAQPPRVATSNPVAGSPALPALRQGIPT